MADNKFYTLIGLMLSANRLHKRAIETVVDDIGIHRGRHRLLMNISKQSFKSQKELAEHMGISAAAVTGMISRLEEDGLISRSRGNDSRFNEISITEKGQSIVDSSREHFFEVDKNAFLGLSEEELRIFAKCLTVMKSNLENIIEEKQ